MSNKTSYEQFKADVFGLLIYLIVWSIIVFLFKILVLTVCFSFYGLFLLVNKTTGNKKPAEEQAVTAANVFFFTLIFAGLYWFFSQVNGLGSSTPPPSTMYNADGSYSEQYKQGLEEAKRNYDKNMFGR